MITPHPSFERLSELVDGGLAGHGAAEVEEHVASCATCREQVARLNALLDRAAALPQSIDPPADAWSALRARLGSQRPAVAARPASRAWDWGLRAAAAVLLVVGSSAVTVLALRSRADDAADASRAQIPTAVAIPAAVVAVERSYADVVAELTATLEAQRGGLTPETIATLRRTLRVIDEAIAEARAALAVDPANDAIVDVLTANYEQKVELLRRASELPART